MSVDSEITVEKTEWTQALIEDLCTALSNGRDDATVRGFARELMDDKGMPLAYLLRKVSEAVGDQQAKRLEILVRGRHAVEKAPLAGAGAGNGAGVLGFMKKLLRQ